MKTRDLLILSQIKGVGPAFFMKNRNRFAELSSYENILSEFKPEEVEFVSNYEKQADCWIESCVKMNVELINYFSTDYPSRLLEIPDAPPVLFLKGNKALLSNAIAIIGTRHSSNLGNRIAERLGFHFSNEFAICNGLVEGIDEHSIYVNGEILPNVIGIISGGIDYSRTCSKKHCKIIEDVLSNGGLIVSEFMPDKREDSFSGSKASRIQAGLSCGLILVQSAINGGSKYTIKSFSKLHRPLGVIYFPQSEEYSLEVFGANRLLLEQKERGIAQFIGLSTIKGIDVSTIMSIESRADYNRFSMKCKSNDAQSLLF